MSSRKTKFSSARILALQAAGFLTIIVLCFLNEWLGLTTLIFKDHPYISNYPEFALEMLFILAVWFIVGGATRRLTNRLQHLEKFMLVCAWCHRVKFHGSWIRLEEFLNRGFDTPTSHGICTGCLDDQKAALQRAHEARQKAAETTPAPQS
jgi:hypothetical protein